MPKRYGSRTVTPTSSQPGLLDYISSALGSYADSGNPWFSEKHSSALAWEDIEEYKKTTGYDLSNDPDGYIASRLDEISGSVGVDSSGLSGGLLGTLKKVVPKNPLIVQHNIHPKALERAERIGGIPSPSVAISKADDPLTGYGDISLLGTSDLATPSARNPVYRSDGYTSRMPHVEIVPDQKTQELVKKFYKTEEGVDSMEATHIFQEIMSKDTNYLESDALREAFLQSKGVQSPKLRFKKTDTHEYKNKMMRDRRMNNRDLIKPFEDSWQVLPWLKRQRNRIEKEGGGFSERIFKGHTEMGNSRYASATVDNIVKDMKKGAGQEGGFGSTAGGIRSQVTPKFKSLAEVKKNRSKVVSEEEFSNAKNELKQEMYSVEDDIHAVVNKHYKNKDDRHFASNHAYESLIEDIFVSTPRKSDYGEGLVDSIKPETIEKAKVLRQKMAKMPTEYFEAKPRRGVALSEFKGALIPNDMDPSIKKLLKKSGIKKVLEYGSDEERKLLFKKFPELMFGLLPPALIGGSLLED